MNKSSTLILKIVIVLVGIGVLAGMLWFPQTEGRAANLDLLQIYADPLIILVYIGSIPFFFGLYQAFKLLNLIDADEGFSQEAVNCLRKIELASLSLIGFIAVTLIYIRLFADGEDAAGPTGLGIIVALAFGVVATAAGVFEKLFQNAVDLKMDNDLTI